MLLDRQKFVYNVDVTLAVFIYNSLILFILGRSETADMNERIRKTAYCRTYQNRAIFFNGYGNYIRNLRHIFRIGDRAAAEFKHLHIFISIFR